MMCPLPKETFEAIELQLNRLVSGATVIFQASLDPADSMKNDAN